MGVLHPSRDADPERLDAGVVLGALFAFEMEPEFAAGESDQDAHILRDFHCQATKPEFPETVAQELQQEGALSDQILIEKDEVELCVHPQRHPP